MVRKVLVSALMTAFAGSALAASFEPQAAAPAPMEAPAAVVTKSVFDGPYIGLDLGANLKKQTVKSGSDVAATSGAIAITETNSKMKRRATVGLYGGFSKVFDRFLVGAEVFANTQFGKKTTNTQTQTNVLTSGTNDTLVTKTKSQIKSSYGLDIRPGFMVTDTGAIYLIGGIQRSRARFEVDSTYTNGSETDSLVSKKSRNVTGYRYGIGYQQNLVDNLAARIEYVGIRNTKSSKNTVSGSTTTSAGNVLSNSGSFKLKNQHMIKVGMHYYFM